MDSTEAIDYLKQMHGEEASQTTEPANVEDTTATGEQTVNEETPAPESEAKTDREPVETEVNETKAEEVPQPKKKPSKQEQVNHAFQRLKRKNDSIIAENESEELSSELTELYHLLELLKNSEIPKWTSVF